ncbi:hypothetical protein NR798_31015 [Archangium gephyra]|uniref:hypothetical protein n=1 Tax=Archangium gephyra TaxID=48 RepID=UPI0035D47ADA
MGYRVRTPDGELAYPTLRDVEVAYTQGLVDPSDEVLEDGHTTWRKASSIPALARARSETKSASGRAEMAGGLVAVVLGLWALRRIMSDSWVHRGQGIVIALAMSAVLTWLTVKAARRRTPPRD